MRRRGATDGGGVPPAYLLSLPVWIAQGHSADPMQAALDWERARDEWTRGARSLDEINALYGPGFDPGPQVDPRERPTVLGGLEQVRAQPRVRTPRVEPGGVSRRAPGPAVGGEPREPG